MERKGGREGGPVLELEPKRNKVPRPVILHRGICLTLSPRKLWNDPLFPTERSLLLISNFSSPLPLPILLALFTTNNFLFYNSRESIINEEFARILIQTLDNKFSSFSFWKKNIPFPIVNSTFEKEKRFASTRFLYYIDVKENSRYLFRERERERGIVFKHLSYYFTSERHDWIKSDAKVKRKEKKKNDKICSLAKVTTKRDRRERNAISESKYPISVTRLEIREPPLKWLPAFISVEPRNTISPRVSPLFFSRSPNLFPPVRLFPVPVSIYDLSKPPLRPPETAFSWNASA